MLIVAFRIELLLLFNIIVIIIDRSDPDLQVQFLETSERQNLYRCKYHPNLVLIQYGIILIQTPNKYYLYPQVWKHTSPLKDCCRLF